MKKVEFGKIALESLVGMAITLVVEVITTKIKNRNKQISPDSTMVGDLTVAELRKIIREEA